MKRLQIIQMISDSLMLHSHGAPAFLWHEQGRKCPLPEHKNNDETVDHIAEQSESYRDRQ